MAQAREVDNSTPRARISIVAALGATTRVIGRKNELLWHLPEDLKRFKRLTLGHPVVMGRKTWESLPPQARPLPGRRNIVVTRQAGYAAPGAEVAASLEAALARTEGEEVFVIGGGELYAAALPLADTLYLTLVDDEPAGDAYFPVYEGSFHEVAREEPREEDGIRYQWVTFER